MSTEKFLVYSSLIALYMLYAQFNDTSVRQDTATLAVNTAPALVAPTPVEPTTPTPR